MPGPVQSVERAAAALRLLARSSTDLALSELAQSLGLAKSTVHGIVQTLHQLGFVDQDRKTGRYRIGRALQELESTRTDVHELRSHATNWTDGLAARSGHAARVCTVVDGAVVVVHHVFRPDESRQQLEVGSTRPPHACAMGKVLLAHGCLPPLRAAQLDPLASRTLTDRPGLLAELAVVRRQHWAVDRDELAQGQAGIAAPVRAPGGLVVAAVGLSGEAERLCTSTGAPRPKLLEQVRDCARHVSRELAEA